MNEGERAGGVFHFSRRQPSSDESNIRNKKIQITKEEIRDPSIKSRAFDTHGVRFIPAEVVFYNVFRGQCYTTDICILNISPSAIHLSISQPYSSAFHIKDNGSSVKLAPGLSITRKMIFKCSEGTLFNSVIPIRVTQGLVLLPIKVIPGQMLVSVVPQVINFGRIDLGSAFVTKTVKLINKGSITAKYLIDMSKNELDVMVTPKSGNIKPFGSIDVKVQLAGLVVGEHETEFWVKATPASRFTVKVTVVVPFLRAIHPFATDEFTLLDMKSCFTATHRYETFLVRNVSSDQSTIVVLAECDGQVMPLDQAANDIQCFQYFRMYPTDGSLAPFENRLFTIWFAPKPLKRETGWKNLTKNDRNTKHLCFFRIQRVTVTRSEDPERSSIEEPECELALNRENDEDDLATRSTKVCTLDNEKHNIIRVCAYGVSIDPTLNIVPDELVFNDVRINVKDEKVLRIYNPCDIPLGFSHVKQADISVIPTQCTFIEPRSSIDVVVQMHARSLNRTTNRLAFDMLSYKNMTDEKNVSVVGRVSIALVYTVKATPKSLDPVFLGGLTPKTNLEGEAVGLHTEKVLFSSSAVQLPAAVMRPKPTKSKPWLTSNDRIAFPNDRRRSLRVTKHDQNVKSIFTGKPRYNVPYNPADVYSRKELNYKNIEAAKYKATVSKYGAKKIADYKEMAREEFVLPEYEVDDEKLYALLGIPPPAPACGLITRTSKAPTNDILCPLTPLQLFNIKTKPQTVDFGKVPPNTDCSQIITVDNLNSFPISVRFVTYKASLKVDKGTIVVQGMSTSVQRITLNLDDTGKHYTNMTYVINTYHSYDIKVCAEVEVRNLIVKPGELTFRDSSDRDIFEHNSRPVILINPLESESDFKWKIPSGSVFDIVPKTGRVAAKQSMTCIVFFDHKHGNQLGTVFVLQVVGGVNSHFPVNFIPSNEFTLTLFSPKISCPDTPLGIVFVKKIIIYNYGRRTTSFSIDDRELPKALKVIPYAGMIKPRSCFTLTVLIQFTEIKKFSFKVPISSILMKNITLTCNGYVSFPQVTFHPPSLLFRKTPLHSHSCSAVKIKNESRGNVELKFEMDELPQFKISTTNKVEDLADNLIGSVVSLLAMETRSLYFHFEPHDIARYDFCVPVVINDILGPPIASDPQTLTTKNYVAMVLDARYPAVKLSGMVVPEKLSIVSVEVAVQRGFIQCSPIDFLFSRSDIKEKGGQTLLIENIMPHSAVTVRIQVPEKKGPFSINSKNGVLIREDEKLCIEETESLELTVLFRPPTAGTFTIGVPIFVEEFSEQRPYTTLKLSGVFYRSSLTCCSSMVNFVPVDLDVEVDRVISIVANYQPEDTKLSVELVGTQGDSLEDIFSIVYPDSDAIPYGIDNYVIPIKIKFRSDNPVSVIGFFTARDGYDGECTVLVTAVADKSILTTYIFQFLKHLSDHPNLTVQSDCKSQPKLGISEELIEEVEQYPLFPDDTSESKYAKHMRRTKESMEIWLYEQGFQGVYQLTIGEDYFLSDHYQATINAKHKNVHFQDVISILDFIIKLAGREFTAQYPLPPNVPLDAMGRVNYAVVTYRAVLSFLIRQGAHLIHVSPLYLLSYDDYTAYHEKLKPVNLEMGTQFHEVSQLEVIIEKESFLRLSIQCWLDFFLQLYKVLVFYPSTMQNDTMLSTSTIEPIYDIGNDDKNKKRSKTRIQPERGQRGPSAGTGCDLGGGEDRLLHWMNNLFATHKPWCVPPRHITNFKEDLEDGVVLAVISSHFCPFLQEKFWTNLYLNPVGPSECQQNMALLCLAWSWIKLGLSVTTKDIMDLHPVKMLMVCCLLYTFLPTYLPVDTLMFEACLTESVKKQLELTNPSDHAIGFSLMKFDSHDSFQLSNSKTTIVIPPKKSCSIKINFTAKNVHKVSGTIVLCGSQLAGGYANNLVFNLKGMPAKLQHRFAVSITCPIYKVAKVKTNLNSPFSAVADFTLSLSENEPKPGSTANLKPWSESIHRKVIRSIYIPVVSATIPASMDMPVPFTIMAAALHSKPKEYWIIFSNLKAGDFLVKVTNGMSYAAVDKHLVSSRATRQSSSEVSSSTMNVLLPVWTLLKPMNASKETPTVTVVPEMKAPQHILHYPFPCGLCTTSSTTGPCDQLNCPLIVRAPIPAKNFKLWAAVRAMMSHTLNDFEKAFWDEYLETGLGLKLMAWIARQYNFGYSDFLFQTEVTYEIECNSPLVTCPSSITIEDVHADGSIDLPIHVSPEANPPLIVDIKLRSEYELRYYQLYLQETVDDGISEMHQQFNTRYEKQAISGKT